MPAQLPLPEAVTAAEWNLRYSRPDYGDEDPAYDHVIVAFDIRPADVFDDVRQVIGPKRPDANVCWCLSYRIPSRLNRELRGPKRGELVAELCRRDPPPAFWPTTTAHRSAGRASPHAPT